MGNKSKLNKHIKTEFESYINKKLGTNNVIQYPISDEFNELSKEEIKLLKHCIKNRIESLLVH